MLYTRPSVSMASLHSDQVHAVVRRRLAEPVEHPADRLGEHLVQDSRIRRLPLEQAEGVLGQRQRVAAGLARPCGRVAPAPPATDRPRPGPRRLSAGSRSSGSWAGPRPRASALLSGDPGGAGAAEPAPAIGPAARSRRPARRSTGSARAGKQAGAEVGREQELIELHVREIGRAEDHVRALDDELAVEPAAHDAVRIGPIPRRGPGCSA